MCRDLTNASLDTRSHFRGTGYSSTDGADSTGSIPVTTYSASRTLANTAWAAADRRLARGGLASRWLACSRLTGSGLTGGGLTGCGPLDAGALRCRRLGGGPLRARAPRRVAFGSGALAAADRYRGATRGTAEAGFEPRHRLLKRCKALLQLADMQCLDEVLHCVHEIITSGGCATASCRPDAPHGTFDGLLDAASPPPSSGHFPSASLLESAVSAHLSRLRRGGVRPEMMRGQHALWQSPG